MKKLLLIEDDLVAADIYRNRFAAAGFEVSIALDGEAGVQMVQSVMPDVIILDLILPKMSGVEVLKNIRANEETQHIPVVVLTNAYLSAMVSEAWRAGATKCLSKVNCTPKNVVEIVKSVLEDYAESRAQGKPALPQPQLQASARPSEEPVDELTKAAEADRKFIAELRKQFVAELPTVLTSLRAHLQEFIKSESEGKQLNHLYELQRRLHALTGNAGLTGLVQIAHLSAALEALTKELREQPKNITASTLRTMALGIDFLGVLFAHAASDGTSEIPSATALVVDDEAISRRAIVYALQKAKLRCVIAENGEAALRLAERAKFDFIALDVDLPDVTGYELCTKIRALPDYGHTPIVFVTPINDFESRANTTLSGGTDLIAKPFLFVELAIKALVYVWRNRLPRGPEQNQGFVPDPQTGSSTA
ncbi:MAG: response regulator [Verrucomicrobiae bacterium]|nr:response regulator [Verrucomicrobiae bacterium]MCX7721945.1 response regulator [Verrucomicrobiae bacterium]MDW7979220.1 response regulator [Verrucomicrobiales bacterium]